jgi:ABC-type branched-subunit amino acid transport system substrate-binding protein
MFTPVSLGIQGYIKQAKVPFINCGSGNEALVDPPNCNPYFFKGRWGNPQACRAAEYPAKKYGGRVFFLSDNYGWGKSCTQWYKETIKRVTNLEVLGEDYPPFNTDNYAPYISKMKALKPDFVALGITGGGYARFNNQAAQMDLNVPLHQNVYNRPDIMACGDSALGMTAAADYMIKNKKIPRCEEINTAYFNFTGDNLGNAGAATFNSIEVICKAIQDGKSTKPDDIVRSLEKIVYEDGIISKPYRFRWCDHTALMDIYIVEVVRDKEYVYDSKVIGKIEDPELLMSKCGQTGCEELIKL